MEPFLKRLQNDLSEFSPQMTTITVIRRDLEQLLYVYDHVLNEYNCLFQKVNAPEKLHKKEDFENNESESIEDLAEKHLRQLLKRDSLSKDHIDSALKLLELVHLAKQNRL